MNSFVLSAVFAGAVLMLGGCDTLGSNNYLDSDDPQVHLFQIEPATANSAGDKVKVTADWNRGSPPFRITLDSGGGATPAVSTSVVHTGHFVSEVTLDQATGGEFSFQLTVVDTEGRTGGALLEYEYQPASNSLPVLSVDAFFGGRIEVTATDADGDDVTVTASNLAGGFLDPPSLTLAGTGGTGTFEARSSDLFAAPTITGTLTPNDGKAEGQPVEFTVTLAGPVQADTLYAIPLEETAGASEAVRIVVAVQVPAQPFRALNAVRVTAPEGFSYVQGSFNVGVPGGSFNQPDGIWTAMEGITGFTAPLGFVGRVSGLGPDETGHAGRTGLDFRIVPVGGSDLTSAGGALFNFEANFAPGPNLLSFQQLEGVNRTYYTDGAGTEYVFGDADNDNGAPNTVVVH